MFRTTGSFFLSCFVVVFFCGTAAGEFDDEIRLSEASVLLPYSGKVNYQIQALNGCFRWVVQRPSLLQLDTLDECGKKVNIRSKFDTPSPRQSTFLTATDVYSRKVLRCEVFFDNVDKIEILTTTRTLYKDEIQRIYIQGYDAVGNTFSSLEGLLVNWEIDHEPGASLLKFVPFSSSSVEPSDVLLRMDNEGKRSSSVLVRGVGVGKVLVAASITDEVSEKGLSEANVSLSILEPLELDPFGDVYLTIGSTFQFLLKTRKQEGLTIIPMPSPKYKWYSSIPTIASIDDLGEVTTHQLGKTLVEAQFVELSDNKANTNVYVVEPAYLDMKISLPNEDGLSSWSGMDSSTSTWFLLSNQNYKIELQAFDKDDHLITMTKNLVPSMKFESRFFDIIDRQHADIRVVTTLIPGETIIEASLLGIQLTQHVTIVPPVSIDTRKLVSSPHLLLPQGHEYTLEAKGGSGAPYVWSTSAIVLIEESSGNSSLVISSDLLGTASIRCKDNKCPLNHDEIPVTVIPPRSVRFLGGPKEVLVGRSEQLFVAVVDEQGRFFDNCSAVPIAVQVVDTSIFRIISTVPCRRGVACPPGACQIYTVHAESEGETYGLATYLGSESQVPLVAYNSLRVSHPVVLVSLGASFTIGVQGGPKAWKAFPGHHSEVITPQIDPNTVKIVPIRAVSPESPWRLYTVTCKSLGTQNILVEVRNEAPGAEIVTQTTQFEFRCREPTSLYIYPNVEEDVLSMPDDCVESMKRFPPPARPPTTSFRVRNNRIVTFKLEAYEGGLSFHNFSSIAVKLQPSDKSIYHLPPVGEVTKESTFPDTFESLHEIGFQKHSGLARLEVTFTDYISEKLSASGVSSYARLRSIKETFSFNLYNPVEVTPKAQVIYLHRDNVFKLDVLHGSSHYITDINATSVIKLDRQQSNTLEMKPITEGHVLMTIIDSCWPKDRAVSDILVSKVHRLRVNVRDMVQIGDTTPLEVIAEDKRGDPFPLSQYKHLSFESHLDHKDILSVRQQEEGSRMMTVHATSLGSCSITITTRKEADGTTVASTPTLVHVFPPLQLVPDRLVLLPGAIIQLQWRGGPPARTELHFEIDNGNQRKTIAEIDSKTGVLHAKEVGETTVVATVFTYVSNEGQNLKSGTTSVPVIVKHLRGIRIVSPSSTLLVGEEMVLEVGGNEGETPFSWYNLEIEFSWEVASRSIQLEPLNKAASIDGESSFGVRAFAKAAGRTTITARITKSPIWPDLVGKHASTTIVTVEPLRLLSPASVLVAPNSHYKIQTNYDHDPITRSSLVYEVLNTEQAWSNYRSTDHPLVSVSSGLVTTTNSVGSMHIRVSERGGPSPSGQSVVLKVTVKPIYQISLSPQAPTPFGIPVGKSQDLDIVVRDEMGTQFDSYDGVSFDYLLNILDVVAVSLVHQGNFTQTDTKGYRSVQRPQLPYESATPSNDAPLYFGHSSLRVDGLSPGHAILRLFVRGDDNSKMVHFPIRVMNSIEPSNVVLHVGGEVQFSTSFLQDDISCKNTAWSSSDNSTVRINAAGFAVAVRPGEAIIYYNCTVHTHTTVRVVPVTHISSGEQQLRFANDQLIVRVPLNFEGFATDATHVDTLVDVPQVKQNIAYRCSLKSHQLVTDRGAQSPLRVIEETYSGGYYCTVFLRASAIIGHVSQVNSIADILSLPPLQVEATSEGQAIVVPLALSKSTPLFEIEEAGKEPLYLTEGSKTVTVDWFLPERTHIPQLEVTVSDSQLEVQEGKEADQTKKSYLIRLGTPAGTNGEYLPFLNAKVTFHYPLTGQQVTLLVSFGYGPRAAGDLADSNLARADGGWAAFASLSAVIILFVCLTSLAYVNRERFLQTQVNVNATPQKAGFMPQPQPQTPFSPPHFQAQPHFGATQFGGITQSSPFMSTRKRSPPASPQSGF